MLGLLVLYPLLELIFHGIDGILLLLWLTAFD